MFARVHSTVVTGFVWGLAALLTGCGQGAGSGEAVSDLEWTQSRSTTTQYAYLDANDLTDEFIFGASVVHVDNFLSSALNMVVRPLNVKLTRRGTGTNRKLEVRTSEGSELLMSFNLGRRSNRDEIDFASAGNDLTLRSIINTVGGIYTASDENGYWVSTGAPVVQQIQQDDDTLVVDLVHTVRQAIVHTDALGRVVVDRYISEVPGDVTVRLYLKRKNSLPSLGDSRTISAGTGANVGYFGTSLGADEPTSKIQRFALGDAAEAQDSITFYMKNVPAAFNDVARTAVLSWNAAFDGGERIKVAQAPDWMDVGDPRFHVVKWFDGLDADVTWAGVAKMIVEPDTGLVMGGNLYLNGGSVLELYKGITSHSQAVAQHVGKVTGTIGNVVFDRDEGEAPVVPYLSDLTQDYDSYMQGYYLETIAHEVGHVLGLRHNFRGTTQLTNNQSASVMDYAPRAERAHYKGPGSYDVAAIQWGYYGIVPAKRQPFCTDENIWQFYDCSQGDWGNAADSAVHGLLDGTLLLTKSTVLVTNDVLISSMTGALENALKIKKLQAQLPASRRAETVRKIDAAYSYLYTAEPDAAATGADLETIKANLAKLRDLAKKAEDALRAAGRI